MGRVVKFFKTDTGREPKYKNTRRNTQGEYQKRIDGKWRRVVFQEDVVYN